MSRRNNPKAMTEVLVDFVTLHYHIGFHEDLNPANLTRLAMLDFDALCPDKQGADCFPNINLGSSHDAAIAEAEDEEHILRILKQAGCDQAAALEAISIRKVLDEEFKQIYM